MTKKNKKQAKFEVRLASLAAWAKMLEEHEKECFSEPERLQFDLHVLYYKLKELIKTYDEVRRNTHSPVAEYMWKISKNGIEQLYKEQEE